MRTLLHDPDADLDYKIDWTDWLSAGDTITTHDVVVEAGDVVLGTNSHDDTSVTAWISGGTHGSEAKVRFRVTTAQGRTDDRSIRLAVTNR